MSSKNKNALIGGLCAIVFVMAVGYAAFATTLNINGTANITSNWDVHIKSITAGAPNGTAKDIPYVAGTQEDGTKAIDATNAQFKAELVAPGDSITYTVEVENGGDLPAKLESTVFNQSQTNTETEVGKDSRAIIYTTDIAEGQTLAAGETKTFTVTVSYNPAVTSQPDTADLTSTLTMSLTYVQDKTA